MDNDQREDERRRREAALLATADVSGGAAVPPRALNQMVSLRLEPQLLHSLRTIADQEGVSVSDLLRQASADLVSRWQETRFRVSAQVTGSPSQTTTVTVTERRQTTVGGVVAGLNVA
jgi:hypothetical protein